MKKSIKSIFLLKKMTPKFVVLQSWKELQVLERKNFLKKSSSLFVRVRPTKRCREFFLIEMRLEKFNCRWFFDSKELFFTIKLLIKLDRQKNQENSAHGYGDNYLTNLLVKFLQDRIKPRRVGALRVCTPTSFNFSRGSC